MPYDKYSCIGGEGWYWERCSANFLVNVTRNMFSETPPVAVPFREGYPIVLGDIQGLKLSETRRNEYYESINNFVLRSSAGTIRSRNDFKFESAYLQELSFLVHVSSSYEELFVRRTSIIMFLQRILRSAQASGASLKPAYPGTSTLCTCGKIPHCEYCPLHDISDSEKEFLFPPLRVGDHVIRGPDWQWGNQGDNEEGVVIMIKDWKGQVDKGVKIRWGNNEENMYRYGAEHCYDVVDAYPMKRDDYQPLMGLLEASETYWSRYVTHYVKNGLAKSKGFFAPHVSRQELMQMLPDYEVEGHRDMEAEQQAMKIINQVIEVAEKDVLEYLSHKHTATFKPSPQSVAAINTVLFPYQIYLFTQAEGDVAGRRCESAILQTYLSSLCSSCVRILTLASPFIVDGRVADLMSALRESAVGQLLPFALNALYAGDFAMQVISYVSGDLQEILNTWCKLMKASSMENDLHQRKDNLLFLPVYDPQYRPVPQPVSWFFTLFYLLTSVSSKIHYNIRFFQIGDKSPELRRLAESWMCSGGLKSVEALEQPSFIADLFENKENRFDRLHQALDALFPEPSWKRKHQPVIVDLELKILAVFCYLLRLETPLKQYCDALASETPPKLPSSLERVWRDVLQLREFIRGKKQEFASMQTASTARIVSTNTIHFVRRSSSTAAVGSVRQERMKEYSLRIRNASMHSSNSLGSTVINKGMRRLMTFEGEDMLTAPAGEPMSPEFAQPAGSFSDFLDEFTHKLGLLLKLGLPLSLQDMEGFPERDWRAGLEAEAGSAPQGKSDEKGGVPQSVEEALSSSIKKYLTVFFPATVNDVEETLQERSENARTLASAIDDAVVMLKTVEDFPQAARLFLLGLSHSLVCWKDAKVEDAIRRDYLNHTDGCNREARKILMSSWARFTEYLKDLFNKCVINLNWRLGCAILYVLVSMNTAKTPYLSMYFQLPHFYQTNIITLSKWFASVSAHQGEVLISPGPMWDSLACKPISLTTTNFRLMLEQFQNQGSYVDSKGEAQGVFPIALLMLTNALRIAYMIQLVDQVADHSVRSIHSAAQNRQSLYFWSVADVNNLFTHKSSQFLHMTTQLYKEFFTFLQHEQEVLRSMASEWQPFAHVLYAAVNSSINPNACLRAHAEKSNVQASLEGDLLISAGEALLTSYMGFLVFASKTKLRGVIPFAQYGDMLWNMLSFSPRIQRLTLSLFQYICSATPCLPPPRTPHSFHCNETPHPLLTLPESMDETQRKRLFALELLHLAAHTDTCITAVVGERAPCALCCPFSIVLYHCLCDKQSVEEQATLLAQLQQHPGRIMECSSLIRADGHGASYSNMITSEEAVYLLRSMLDNPFWTDTLTSVFREIVAWSKQWVDYEHEHVTWSTAPSPRSDEVFIVCIASALYCRTPWLTALTGVLKVLGALTPRVYSGCRIRVQEYLMEGQNDGTALMQSAFLSNGGGYVIKCNRTMSNAMVLMDKIDTPTNLSIYAFDVVDKVKPSNKIGALYASILDDLQSILLSISLNKELAAMPSKRMPFFNTTPLALPAHHLQDVILFLHLVRAMHYMTLATPDLVTSLKQPVISALLRLAEKPVPCNAVFGSSLVKEYFNWFMEYLINTYPGSPRFLPMELQSENYSREHERTRRSDMIFGLGKEEEVDYWDDGRPKVIYDETRMAAARTIAGMTGYSVDVCYKILRAFQDNSNEAATYILQSSREFILSLTNSESQIHPVGDQLDDQSVLSDLETSLRKPLLPSQGANLQFTDHFLSTVLPPFSRLQPADKVLTDGIVRSTSLYGVISCVCDKELVYGPIEPTGVITAVSNGSVRLSVLNTESGLVEDTYYKESEVAVQKYRLLFHLDDVQHLRGIVARLAQVLLQLYVREYFTCLINIMQPRHDVIDTWQINPYDIVRLTKFAYLSYRQSLISQAFGRDNESLQAYLFRLVQAGIRQLLTSSRSFQVIQAFMDGTWDDTDKNRVTLYVPEEEERQTPTNSSKQLAVSSISMGSASQGHSVYVSSLHDSFPKTKYSDKVTIPGAAGLRILFDPRCKLDPKGSALTFFQDEAMTQVIARFTGTAEAFCPFTVRGNTVWFMYESDMTDVKQWGYGFLIQPFENVNWNNDGDVLSSRCFDWNCYAYDFLIDLSYICNLSEDNFFNRSFENLIMYLRTAGMPFKARVVELLMRISHAPTIHLTARPDTSEMLDAVMAHCSNIDRKSIVPPQVPLLVEFLIYYSLRDLIPKVTVADTPDAPIPAFNEKAPIPSDDLCSRLCTVHLFVYCLYYRSLLPQTLVHDVFDMLSIPWNEEKYMKFVQRERLFSRAIDGELLQCFALSAQRAHSSMLEFPVCEWSLSEDDRARFYSLSEVEEDAARERLAVIQLFNRKLQSCVHLIELMGGTRGSKRQSVGAMITAMSEYVFPLVKEDVLEIAIKQTEYCGQEAYPAVELDNRRVFTELEREDEDYETADRSAVTSQCMFAQLYRQMKNINPDVLRAKLDSKDRLVAIKYKGEQGLDWGGLYRDTIERCVEDLFSDHIDLFIPAPGAHEEGEEEEKFIPNPRYRDSSEAMQMYRFVGMLIGISLRTKHLLPFDFSSQIWKTIVGAQVGEEDLESVDSGFVSTLRQVREYSEADGVEEFPYVFDLVFAILDSTGNEVELVPSGSQIPVTFHSRMKFCEMAVEARINEASPAAEAIASGVYALIPQRALSLFTWEQLELAVKGEPDIPVDVLKRHAVYIGWTENHEVVQRFWRVMEQLTDKDRSQFLRFVWGRSKLPKSEHWSRPFKLTYKNAGDQMLPVAHTCFFQLELPQYSSDQIMKERLLVAFHYGSSGEFIIK